MSANAVQASGQIIQGQNFVCKARLLTSDDVVLTNNGASSTATVSSMTCKVYDITDESAQDTMVNEGTTQYTTVTVASAFVAGSASPYLTTGWNLGGEGFNFGHHIAHSDSAVGSPTQVTVRFKGGHTYRVVYEATLGVAASLDITDDDVVFTVDVYVVPSFARAT